MALIWPADTLPGRLSDWRVLDASAPVTAAPRAPVDVARVAVARRSTEIWYCDTAALLAAVAVKTELSAEVPTRLAPAFVTVKFLIFATRSSRAVPTWAYAAF